MNIIQQRFEGFLKTPTLWSANHVYNLTQFEINQTPISFSVNIDSNLRLGKYIERFVSHQLLNDDSTEIISENIQLFRDKITVGELDCLLLKNNKPIHLEIIYKFYVYNPDTTNKKDPLHCWIGPNRKDSLVEKLEKLQNKQLPLLYSKECLTYLKNINLESSEIKQQVYFKAQLFVPYSRKNNSYGAINLECIKGFYLHHNEVQIYNDAKFYIPSKKDWLIIPHTNVNWLTYQEYLLESNYYLLRKFSPLCWLKTSTGELSKFFLVWW